MLILILFFFLKFGLKYLQLFQKQQINKNLSTDIITSSFNSLIHYTGEESKSKFKLYCKFFILQIYTACTCYKTISSTLVFKHQKHNNLVEKSKQTFIKSIFENRNKQQSVAFDLCQAMLESDIPLWKLNHPSFKSFFKKYTEKSVPDQSQYVKNTFLPFMKALFHVSV